MKESVIVFLSFLRFFLQTCTVAIVCPDQDVLVPWAKKNGIDGEMEDLCNNEVRSSKLLS